MLAFLIAFLNHRPIIKEITLQMQKKYLEHQEHLFLQILVGTVLSKTCIKLYQTGKKYMYEQKQEQESHGP